MALKSGSILVVDDIPEMRELLAQILTGLPEVRSVSLAANIWEARLEWTRRRPDLVILDEVLPGESSLDFVVELKKDGVPILLVTGIRGRNEPLPEGASARLLKPMGRDLETDRKPFQAAIQDVFSRLQG